MLKDIVGGITFGQNLGGWTIVGIPTNRLPQDLASGFNIALQKFFGSTLLPQFYVGNQVVNGKNHLVICKETMSDTNKTERIVAAVINIPPGIGGKGAKITHIIDSTDPEVPEDIKNWFNESVKGLVGAKHKPLLYIGQQVVSGINHFIITDSNRSDAKNSIYPALAIMNVKSGKAETKIENLIK